MPSFGTVEAHLTVVAQAGRYSNHLDQVERLFAGQTEKH
jgi:hypothetical protein